MKELAPSSTSSTLPTTPGSLISDCIRICTCTCISRFSDPQVGGCWFKQRGRGQGDGSGDFSLRWILLWLPLCLCVSGGRIVYDLRYFTILFTILFTIDPVQYCTQSTPRVKAGVNVLACFLDFKCDEADMLFVCLFRQMWRRPD